MNPTSLYHQLQRLCAAARLPRMKVHDCRHTAAKFYTDLHIEERYIKALLGHAPNITGHYAPPDADALRPFVEQVYGLVAGDAERGRKTG
jgi:integrase